MKLTNAGMNSTLTYETLPSEKENDKAEFSRACASQNICIFISQLEIVVSVSRVTEEAPDEDTIVVSKRRVL